VHDMRQSAAAMPRFLSIAALTFVLHGTGLSGQTTTAVQSTRIPHGGYDTPTSWGELIVPSGSGPFPIAVLTVRALAAGRTTFPVADYPKLAKDAGDSVKVQIVPDADHFDFLTPSKPAWPAVETALTRIFGIKATH